MDNYIVRTTEDLLSDDICGEVFFDCTEKIIPAILDRAMRRITAFNVSEENPYYTSYEGILYSKDGKKVIKSPAKKSGNNSKVACTDTLRVWTNRFSNIPTPPLDPTVPEFLPDPPY